MGSPAQPAAERIVIEEAPVETGPANLVATLNTPLGLVVLESHGI